MKSPVLSNNYSMKKEYDVTSVLLNSYIKSKGEVKMKNTLDKMCVNQKSTVVKIQDGSSMKRRFLDIGLTEKTEIECVLVSYGGEMKAYCVKGAIIGIRKEDAKLVEILPF